MFSLSNVPRSRAVFGKAKDILTITKLFHSCFCTSNSSSVHVIIFTENMALCYSCIDGILCGCLMFYLICCDDHIFYHQILPK